MARLKVARTIQVIGAIIRICRKSLRSSRLFPVLFTAVLVSRVAINCVAMMVFADMKENYSNLAASPGGALSGGK